MDFDFIKNNNFNCFFVDYSFSDDLIELTSWRNVCHFRLFNELKMSFGSCYIDLRIDKCYVIAQWGAYVLDIKEYKKFLKKYSKKEKKIYWAQDGF